MDLLPAFRGLSDEQRVYVQARLEGQSPYKAVEGMGKPRNSWRILENHPAVVQALKAAREECIKATGVTRERVSQMLLDAYENATTTMEQVAAARELGKLHGLYEAQKIQHELSTGDRKQLEKDLKSLPLHELERMVVDAEFVDVTPGKDDPVGQIEDKRKSA